VPKSIRAKVKPELLKWARENAGYSIDSASQKIKVTSERLLLWEKGEDFLSVSKLKQISKLYKFPLSVFYLPAPPKNFQVMHDFRIVDGNLFSHSYTPALKYEIRLAQQRRELALELYSDLNEKPELFDYNATMHDNPEKLGLKVRKLINIDFKEQSGWKDSRTAFNNIYSKIEKLGVLVFQTAWTNKIDIKEMRGFSIANKVLPVIVINRKDSINGKIFSLLHEFIHLMLGKSGVSNLTDYDKNGFKYQDQMVEVFCNHVSAATLVPTDYFLAEKILNNHLNTDMFWNDNEISDLARKYNVSNEVILRRLLVLGRTNEEFYRNKRSEFIEKGANKKEGKTNKFMRNIPNETFISLGNSYIKLVFNNYYKENISLNQLSDFLGGIKIKHIEPIKAKLAAVNG